jgi:hypothetical protein
MLFKAQCYMADAERAQKPFWQYTNGDPLVKGPVLAVEADSEDAALDKVFEIGNIGTPDADGNRWPPLRSLSCGDVIVIGETAYAVASFGFDRIETEALEASLTEAVSL